MRVFISYSHDSDAHKDRVFVLACELRARGIAAQIDLDMHPGGPHEGWPLWCERQVREADRVLVVCTATYRRRYEGTEPLGTGCGATSEALQIRQEIYDRSSLNEKFRAVLFDGSTRDDVPDQLRRCTHHKFFRQSTRTSPKGGRCVRLARCGKWWLWQ